MFMNLVVFARSESDRPLRYRDEGRNLKHAGQISVRNNNNDLGILNYNTGFSYNYKTNASYNYNNASGLNYRPATNLRYR